MTNKLEKEVTRQIALESLLNIPEFLRRNPAVKTALKEQEELDESKRSSGTLEGQSRSASEPLYRSTG